MIPKGNQEREVPHLVSHTGALHLQHTHTQRTHTRKNTYREGLSEGKSGGEGENKGEGKDKEDMVKRRGCRRLRGSALEYTFRIAREE